MARRRAGRRRARTLANLPRRRPAPHSRWPARNLPGDFRPAGLAHGQTPCAAPTRKPVGRALAPRPGWHSSGSAARAWQLATGQWFGTSVWGNDLGGSPALAGSPVASGNLLR